MWSVLYPDVSKRHGKWYVFFQKLRRMSLAAIAPEAVLSKAYGTYLASQFWLKRIKNAEAKGWTLMHVSFALTRCFEIESGDGQIKLCEPTTLERLVQEGHLTEVPISGEELRSRSRSDWFIRCVAIFQTAWFALQSLLRVVQHLQVTALEIAVIAFIFCCILTYFFCWYQSQDIEYAVLLKTTASVRYNDLTNIPSERPPLFTLALCGTPFGAVHCLTWDSVFQPFRKGWHGAFALWLLQYCP